MSADKTRAYIVWRCIKDCGPITVREIAALTRIEPRNVSHSIYHMRTHNTALRRDGAASAGHWFVPPGGRYACIGKGNHKNSRDNLSTWDWQKGLAAIRNKRGIQPRPKFEPHSLEACWQSPMKARQS